MRLDNGSMIGGRLIASTDDVKVVDDKLTEHKSDWVSHVTEADRSDWDGKETPSGAQAKVNAHANLTSNPHNVTKSQVGLGNVSNVLQASKSEFDAHTKDTVSHLTAAERTKWDSKAEGSHTHLIADIQNLQNELDKKASKTEVETSSGNAEKAATDYAKEWGLGSNGIQVADFNDAIQGGFYWAEPGALNAPESGYYVIFVSAKNETSARSQIAILRNAGGLNNRMFHRSQYSGVWGPWVETESVEGAQGKVDSHANLTNNPHGVTKSQVGLGNVSNVLQASKSEFDIHTADKTNPHGVTKSQVGLGNVSNVLQASKSEFDTHTKDTVVHITAAERTAWDAKETPSGAQAKATAALNSAKSYTDQEVSKLIDSAPGLLDTFNEIAEALGNDPNFATTMTTQLSNKVDKVAGMGLSQNSYTTTEKNKLAGIESGANNYVHPSSHPASMITQSASYRFVTDSQISTWNAKETTSGSKAKADAAEKAAKDASVPKVAVVGDDDHVIFNVQGNYTGLGYQALYRGSGSGINNEFAIQAIDSTGLISDALTIKNDGSSYFSNTLYIKGTEAETTSGAQAKVNAHSSLTNNPHNVTKSQVGLGNVSNVLQASKTEFDTHTKDTTSHITAAERNNWNSKAPGTHSHAISEVTGLQTALDGKAASSHNHDTLYYRESEVDTLLDNKVDKTITLTGGTGIEAIGDLSGNRTISIDTSVARKNARSDGYHWMRRASTAPTLYVTQQSSGPIVEFRQGAGDGTVVSSIDSKGGFTGNAASASKWDTARTITLGGDLSGSVSIDGSTNVSLSAQVLDDSHNHTKLEAVDQRTTSPADFSNANREAKFIFTSVDNNGTGPYADALVMSTYKDSSGGGLNMLMFRKDKGEIYHRFGSWNGTAWDNYRKLAYTDEIRWENVDGKPSSFIPATHDHDDRYYLKTQVDGFLKGKSDTNHTHTLSSLTDTTITSPANGHFLRHNGTRWVNTTISAVDVPSLDTSKITTGVFSTARLPKSTTTVEGIVQLNNSTASTSTSTAATAAAVKKSYDLADAAIPKTGGTATGRVSFEDGIDLKASGANEGFTVKYNQAEKAIDFIFI